MKKTVQTRHILSIVLVAVFLTKNLNAIEIAASNQPNVTQEERITYRQRAPERPEEKGYRPFALGFSTINVASFGTGSISAILKLSDLDLFQAFVSVPQTSSFNIGGMILYKRTIFSSLNSGFHVGGGSGVATVNNGAGAIFALNVIAVGGFHFSLPAIPHIEFHLDGGANFYLLNTIPDAQRQLQVASLTPALGLSILYYF
jgi:hypothetical protein